MLNREFSIEQAYQYFDRYEDRFKYRFRLRLFTIILVIIFLLLIIINEFIKDFGLTERLIYSLITLILSYPIIIKYHIRFYKKYGVVLLMKVENHQSKRIVTEVLHGFVHTDDDPGTGKDTFQNFATLSWDEHIRDDIHEIRYELEKVLYMFNLTLLEKVVKGSRFFDDASEQRRADEFQKTIQVIPQLIKERYRDELSFKKLFEDKVLFDEDYRTATYVNTDTLNYNHWLDELYMYAYSYYRIEVIDMFIMSNQPMLDSNRNPAFIFSERFFWFKSEQEPIKNPDKSDKDIYIPKHKFVLENWIAVSLTEQDILNNNLDKAISSSLASRGTSAFFKGRRHLCGDKFIIFSNAQTEGRQAKLIRENYTFKCGIIRRPHLISLFPEKVEKQKNKNDKLDSKIELLEHRIKYKKYSVKKKTRKEKRLDSLCERRERFKKKLGALKYKGYVKMEIAIRPRKANGGLVNISKSDLLDRDKTMPLDAVVVEIAIDPFNWQHYNTHFLKPLGENVRQQTTICLRDIKRYTNNLQFSNEQAKETDSMIIDKMLNIPFKETANDRYDIQVKPSKNKNKTGMQSIT